MHEMYWELALSQFKFFFEKLGKIKPVSLSMTRKVLTAREKVAVMAIELQISLKNCLNEVGNMEKNIETVSAEQHKLEANKDHKIKYEKQEPVHTPKTSGYTTYCPFCVQTCHADCNIEKDEDKLECWAMSRDTGRCRICKDKCT
eukprot:UN10527